MNLAAAFVAPPLDRTALVVDGRRTSYGELGERVDRWRVGLVAAGVSIGDRVALLAGNTEVFVIGYLACLAEGFVVVPLNPDSPPAEVERELLATEPTAAIVGERGREAWLSCVDHGSAASSIGAQFVASGRFIEALDSIELGESAGRPVVEVPDDHPAALLFTSGTAGTPRAAILTHGNFLASLASIGTVQPDLATVPHTALAVIPLFHVFGLNVIINLGLRIGSTIVLEDHLDAERTAGLIRDHDVSILVGPPTMWNVLLADEGVQRDDLASIQLAVSGAAKLDPSVAEDIQARLGVDIREGYGLTETCGIVSTAMNCDAPLGSVGQVFPGVAVRLVDQNGDDVLIGDTGEVLVSGDVVSPGYWNDDEATERTRTADGWLKTGDVALVDEHGFLAIVDRLKDLIIVSGFNVHPIEIETILSADPTVALAGVVGEPDALTGERPVAYVVPADGATPDPDALRARCIDQLARYKVPKRVEIVDAIPTTAVGKIRRRDLGRRDG